MTRAPWRVVRACETGTSHQGSGTPCQDHAAHAVVTTTQGPVLVAVVCDGAGSAARSEVGSWLAATTFVELAAVYFTNGGTLTGLGRDRLDDWLRDIVDRLTMRAHADGNAVKDYACTLLAAIIGDSAAAFMQIGDGAIVVSDNEEEGWGWVFWPAHGEYANQTTFVVSENAADALEFELVHRPIEEVAVFSDGIERMVLHGATRTVNERFFDQMIVPVRDSRAEGLDHGLSDKLKAYLGSPAVNARTNDDKTLLLATRRRHSASAPVDPHVDP